MPWPKRRSFWRRSKARRLIQSRVGTANRTDLIHDAAKDASARMDTALRELTIQRNKEFEAALGRQLLGDVVRELANQWRKSGQLLQPLDEARVNQIAAELSDEYGRWLAAGPSQEDVNQVVEVVAKTMDRQKLVKLNPDLLATPRNEFQNAWAAVREQLGLAEQTLFTQMLSTIQTRRTQAWAEHSRRLNYELFDQAVGAFDWSCIEELRKGVAAQQEMQQATTAKIATPTPAAVAGAAHAEQQPVPLGAAAGLEIDPELRTRLQTLRTDLDKPFASRLLLWQKTKDELVDEMDRTIQVPGWGNIFTQPIINRIRHAGDRRADDDRRESLRR